MTAAGARTRRVEGLGLRGLCGLDFRVLQFCGVQASLACRLFVGDEVHGLS